MTETTLLSQIRGIIDSARINAVRSVDFCRVQMYWHIGQRIVEEEQGGEARAEYGKYIIRNLSKQLMPDYCSGFGVRQLEQARQFYIEYPIANTLRSQFNWSQYRALIQIADKDKREYYELEAANNNWTARELERQIHSHLYERLLLSNDKEAVLAVARRERIPQAPTEIVKDPMILEFLGLERKTNYYESDIETEIMNHLQEFILELGNGFTFVARQKRILLEDDEFFADLVFYNRLARCFVVIELKTGKISHADLGQLQMYVNYYDRCEKLPEENPTVGILLCAEKNDTLVKMSLPEDNRTIVAAKYLEYLPTADQLAKEVETVRRLINIKTSESKP
ncbi:MAG: PDDEXK nuclease domain-containing protein [Bacteroides sp.]|nr:PDDEXK nuclease domain-containing protein [Bacteroides sp.]MCM1390495.1 PDDEXK nuclease domain-containing protein [Bacteroides sp.]